MKRRSTLGLSALAAISPRIPARATAMAPKHLLLLSLLATMAVPVWGESPAAEDDPILADWVVLGTTVDLRLAQTFESVSLRVVGPAGFEAEKALRDRATVTIDLLSEGSLPPVEGHASGAPAPATSTPGIAHEPGSQPPDAGGGRGRARSGRRDLTVLPDGAYRLEAVLATTGSTVRARKTIFASGGKLVAGPTAGEADSRTPRTSSAEPAPIAGGPAPITTEDDLVQIVDANDNGRTAVDLQADTVGGSLIEEWRIENRDGDLRLVENDSGTGDKPRLALLSDLGTARVGVGTTAPATTLHIESDAEPPVLRIQDKTGSGNRYFDLQVNNPTGQLWFKDSTDLVILSVGTLGPVRVHADLEVLSSLHSKQKLVTVDSRSILDRVAKLPLFEWEYRRVPGERHVGPTAEGFHELFPLGGSERMISPMDLGGVALAAIQGLRAEIAAERTKTAGLLGERDRELDRLAAERATLAARVAALEIKFSRLVEDADARADP